MQTSQYQEQVGMTTCAKLGFDLCICGWRLIAIFIFILILSLKWVVNSAILNYLKLILVDVMMFFGDFN